MNLSHKPSRRYAEYVRKITCDEWDDLGLQGNDKVVIRHRATGATAAYCLHDGGNDMNGPRNFALDVQRACGCQLIEPRGRKRSRKSTAIKVDPEVEASRRKHAAAYEAARAARENQQRTELARAAAARAAAADDRRRRDIEELMR